MQQPQTATPVATFRNGKIVIDCPTSSASIAYLITDRPIETLNRNDHWQLYTHPLKKEAGKYYYFIAERIGFKTSKILKI